VIYTSLLPYFSLKSLFVEVLQGFFNHMYEHKGSTDVLEADIPDRPI
jgi:hypothetical protein